MRAAIGAIEAAHLEGESNLVFGEFDADDMHDLPPEDFLLVILAWLDMLLKNGAFSGPRIAIVRDQAVSGGLRTPVCLCSSSWKRPVLSPMNSGNTQPNVHPRGVRP